VPVEPVVAYIGLGSNLGDSCAQVRRGLSELNDIPKTRLLAHSSLYRSSPMGPADQPDFINAAAKIETGLTARELLGALQNLEAAHQRIRGGQRWGPRTLDLDLLLYGSEIIHEADLEVPHPGLTERNFVLQPLLELDADLEIPGQGSLRELVNDVPAAGLWRLQ
jgi:2-amino-4-hydroxy-6-hydroxymethyldihydropteridine diphosphokinase